MTRRIDFSCGWQVSEGLPSEHAATLVRLLAGIRATGSLSRAARTLRVSYRFAWGLVTEAARAFGASPVTMQRGRGAQLTRLGEKLLWAEARIAERLAPHLAALSEEISRELGRLEVQAGGRLTLNASHDLALAELRELCKGQIELEVHFQGSQDSLAALAAGRCDVAGFHVAGSGGGDALQLSRFLRPRSHRVVHFVRREQGIIVRPGAPIRRVRDLARPGVRFINRQAGSGTRLLVDGLLARERLDPGRLSGYQDEEFTHLAVAATVAAGRADAGFGIRAAAARHKLDFVPLVTETYYLACKRKLFDGAAFGRLRDLLRGERFRKRIARLPGYDVVESGNVADVQALLGRG